MDFYPLKIKQVIRETADTCTLEFEIPEEIHEKFAFQQGQYITLRMEQNGQELRRSYSMSSSPLENRLAVTVKKVPGGQFSTYLHDVIKAGDTVEAAAPDGRFYNTLHPEKRRTYYLFGAGSGITPLMSILKTILEGEPMSAVFLLYGSRNEESIIFREELDRLTAQYNGQLHVEHILSQPKKEGGGGLMGMFKKSSSNWQGKTGRIAPQAANVFLDDHVAQGPEDDCIYYVCGPGSMADDVKEALLARGVPAKQIQTEYFVNAHHVPGDIADNAKTDGGKRIIVHLKGQRIELPMPEGATILDVLVKEKYDPPYSCTAGACSTCMAKVINGKVKMDACYALDDDEVKDGYILTCQSRLETTVVELTYDM